MQLYKEPPDSKGSYILQGEDPHGAGAYPLPGIDEAPLSIGDSSTRERLWRLFTFQMGQQ